MCPGTLAGDENVTREMRTAVRATFVNYADLLLSGSDDATS